jgi:hypothetical protein
MLDSTLEWLCLLYPSKSIDENITAISINAHNLQKASGGGKYVENSRDNFGHFEQKLSISSR